eukprot:TRINITY_DN3587_c0_g1_i1.p1 TRINITY_DN3587_c0_g1~~TRINITY_DN3587_c0_g1_i1.p1  ORF type:complete len:338 (+),score=51.41 TRINITY_DN3587_c0_g1_i1:90-1103(+)
MSSMVKFLDASLALLNATRSGRSLLAQEINRSLSGLDSGKTANWNVAEKSLLSFPYLEKTISATVFYILDFIGIESDRLSPITSSLPLVSNPAPVFMAVLAYLAVVLGGSHWIRASGIKPLVKEPWSLQLLVICHNSFLCGLSAYMGCTILAEAFSNEYSFWGNPYKDSEKRMGQLIYLFYVSKFYEFMDTMVMLLKRNTRQITALHVYHHTSISIIWWVMAYRCPGGDAYFSAAFNSWVHVIMYAYYLLAATVCKDQKSRKKYLFWGKYLTVVQILQFVMFLSQAIYGIMNPGVHPRGIPGLLFVYSLSLLVFFIDFFIKKHGTPSKAPGKGEKQR